MDTHQPQKTETRVEQNNHGEENLTEGGGRENQPSKRSQPATSPASPPSASSSPSHEFSFTISLHSSSTAVSSDKAKAPPSFAIDLSPADDIFFHGHLLPLHLLSHLPVSPRSSTNSLDSFTLPIRDLVSDKEASKEACNSISTAKHSDGESKHHESNYNGTRRKTKSRPFSLFGLTKWRRESELVPEQAEKENYKRKLKFDVSNVLKRYARMVRPLLSFAGRKDNMQLRRQPFSFSGNLDLKSKQDLRGRRGEYSAPASMRTSPSNSGLLVATTALPSSTSDSTMEELQAAIQAAIAHCKNSIAKDEKLKC